MLTDEVISIHMLVLMINGTNVDEFVIIYGFPRESHEPSHEAGRPDTQRWMSLPITCSMHVAEQDIYTASQGVYCLREVGRPYLQSY